MIATIVWALIAVGIFGWNHLFGDPYIGILGTQAAFGHPVSFGWLASGLSVYCLIRTVVRRRRAGQREA